MITDVHAHLLPSAAAAAARADREWTGTRLGLTDTALPYAELGSRRTVFASPLHLAPMRDRKARLRLLGIDRQVLSLLPPLLGYELPARLGVARCREVNDELAAIVHADPASFVALAALPLQDTGAAIAELHRAVIDLGMPGAIVGSHVAGRDWDDPVLEPVLQAAAELDALLFLHPVAPRAGSLDAYYLRNVLGNPFETTTAAAHLVFGGVMDRLPTLRVLLAHGGGYFSIAAGRMTHAYVTRGDGRCTQRPSEYVSRFLYDSLTHDAAALRNLVADVGIDRVLLGSDFPADMGSGDPLATLAPLDPATRAALAETNPVREIPGPHGGVISDER